MDPSLGVSAIAPGLEIVRTLIESATKSSKEKKTYQQKLEAAEGADVYKYVLLINVAALEGYVAQARLQAQQSFDLSKKIAVIGFGTIIVSICLSVFLTMRGIGNLNAAYLAAIAGVLTEFISGVFFFLYSKTLGQISRVLLQYVRFRVTNHRWSDEVTAVKKFDTVCATDSTIPYRTAPCPASRSEIDSGEEDEYQVSYEPR